MVLSFIAWEFGDENQVSDCGTERRRVHGGRGRVCAGTAIGATDYKQVSEDLLAGIDLAKEIDSVQNRELRLSRAVIEPGGHVGPHSHQGDPTIVYLISGVLTNHHDDGTIEEFRPGQAFAEFGPRSHWVENKGSAPVTFIVANIHRRE